MDRVSATKLEKKPAGWTVINEDRNIGIYRVEQNICLQSRKIIE